MQDVKRSGAHRMRWVLGLLFAFLMLPALVAAPAQAISSDGTGVPPVAVVTVQIVDADGNVVFSERVVTRTHDVTTESGGTHTCDGTNNDANPTPGPTATGALDDAASAYGFTFDGAYYPQFEDYLIDTIDGQSSTSNSYWSISVNGQDLQVGGCQYQVRTGDTVTYTLTSF